VIERAAERRVDWALANLGEFLSTIGSATTERDAIAHTLESASEALDADLTAVVRGRSVLSCLGVRSEVMASGLSSLTPLERHGKIDVAGLGVCTALSSAIERFGATLVVARRGTEPFSGNEAVLLDGMARALALTLELQQRIERERTLRSRSEAMLAITQAISRRTRHDDMFATIAEQARSLLDARAVITQTSVGGVMTVRSGAGLTPDQRARVLDASNRGAFSAEHLAGSIGEGTRVILTPVLLRGETVGMLATALDASRCLVPDELAMLASLAEYTSIAHADEDAGRAVLAERHDRLTGLPGRGLIHDHLATAIAARGEGDRSGPTDRAARSCTRDISVMFVDLDGFKPVNDRYGHDVGDEVLRTVSRRMVGVLSSGPGDGVVGRIGGDEFLAVVHTGSPDIEDLANAIVRCVGDPIAVRMGSAAITASVTASVGLAQAQPGETATELLRRGDRAMYAAKNDGKNRWACDVPDEHIHSYTSQLGGPLRGSTEGPGPRP
jgi:diguanylate cyclase (GGDEF)-like protein